MFRVKESVLSFEDKTTQPWFTYFQINGKYKTYFKTNPLNIIFHEFCIWLLDNRIALSCLYLPQGHYFLSTLWLWSTDEYVFFLDFERMSIFKSEHVQKGEELRSTYHHTSLQSNLRPHQNHPPGRSHHAMGFYYRPVVFLTSVSHRTKWTTVTHGCSCT